VTTAALAEERGFTSPLLGRRERLWPMIAASFALHAAAIGGLVWHAARSPKIDLDQKPIVARLVRQGELRPRELLPRKQAAPAPAPAPEVAVAPAPKPAAPVPAPAPAPSAKAPAAKPAAPVAAAPRAPGTSTNALAQALGRIEQEKVYGDPDGDPRGDADEGEAGDQYLALVTRALQDTYVLPSTISDRERMHLRATVVLFIEPDGRVSRWSFEDRSGNAVFDAALERAVRAARLPPPPAGMRDRYRSQGLAVLYRP
jgi:colicin import membrane protein/protein TonB